MATLGMGSLGMIPGIFARETERATRAVSRRFTMEFNPGTVGISTDQQGAIEMAARYGFESVYAFPNELSGVSSARREELLELLEREHLQWGHSVLPVDFRNGLQVFAEGMEELPGVAQGLQRAGVTRISTWIMSAHEQLTYRQNFRRHANRLREVAAILQEHNIRLALEYVGPRTVWTSMRYPFLHTMAETRELIAAIGLSNVGFHLDTAHWHTAGERVGDLLSLSAEEVVSCDLNDVLAGIPREELPDTQRELPGKTGVVDLEGFLRALVEIGFDGPIQAEPFNSQLNSMSDERAAEQTAGAMKRAFGLIDS